MTLGNIILKINILLRPIENLLTKYMKYLRIGLLVLSVASLGYLVDKYSVKEAGENALLLLWIILWIPIFARVFSIDLARRLLPLRKELGILMGVLAMVHATRFFISDPEFIFTREFWIFDGSVNFLAFGFFALILTIPLTITSNLLSLRILGKWWKILHRSVYLIIILVIFHVVVAKWSMHFEYGPVLLFLLYISLKICEWKGIRIVIEKGKKYPKGQKWICVPCGYIYDPHIGDTDSGIPAGTEFVDIPDTWRCPVCGVTKSDFIPFEDEGGREKHAATLLSKTFLNPSTLEITLKTHDHFESKPGQFMIFHWEDEAGVFQRRYSLVEREGDRYTFTIKIDEGGRGGKYLKYVLKEGDILSIGGIFGAFFLRDTPSSKIFVGTGTGLAPLYHMIRSLPTHIPKSLYLSFAYSDDVYYLDSLRAMEDLDLHIHITKEPVEGYPQSRIDVSTIDAPSDAEWYLCGNPQMVKETRSKLEQRGFHHILSETFL